MDRETSSLLGYTTMLRRRWPIVVAILVIAVAASLLFTMLRPHVYKATSELLLDSTDSGSNSSAIDPEEVATQARVVTSLPVATLVVNDLQLSETPRDLIADITVVTNGTRVLDVSAERDSASESAAIANAFAESYLSYTRQQSVQDAADARRDLADQRTQIQGRLSEIDGELASASPAQIQKLNAERDSLLAQLGQLRASLFTVSDGDPSASAGLLLLPATTPSHAAGPSPLRTAALVALLALIVGIGVALLRDRLDASVHPDMVRA